MEMTIDLLLFYIVEDMCKKVVIYDIEKEDNIFQGEVEEARELYANCIVASFEPLDDHGICVNIEKQI